MSIDAQRVALSGRIECEGRASANSLSGGGAGGSLFVRAKVLVGGREVDFLIGKYAIDIDGHDQEPVKNRHLVAHGYIPIHFSNREVADRISLTHKIKKYVH